MREPETPQSRILEHPEWIEIARTCHDGQFSMLYAVASTGNLVRGTLGGGYESVEEWEADLWSGLSAELGDCVRMFENDPTLLDESDYTFDSVRAFERHVD